MSLLTRERIEKLRALALCPYDATGAPDEHLEEHELLALFDAALVLRRLEAADIDVSIERLTNGGYRATAYVGCMYLDPVEGADALSALKAALDKAEA